MFPTDCDAICAGYFEFFPCDSTLIYGCTDPLALNYDLNANFDDGSCEYDPANCVCPDIWAPVCTPDGLEFPNECFAICEGFNDFFPCDSVLVYGCTDPLALNYDPNANLDDGSCEYDPANCICPDVWDPVCTPDGLIFGNECEAICEGFHEFFPCEDPNDVYGCTDPNAINYDPNATIDDGSCIYPNDTIFGCTDTLAFNYNPWANYDDGSCDYDTTSTCGCPPIWEPVCTADGQLFANECEAHCLGYTDFDLCEEPNDIPGCTDPNAINYDPNATIDDGSCIFDECICPEIWDPVCTPDGLQFPNECFAMCEGFNDFFPCDTTVIWGCTDPLALNYNPEANFDDGSCEYDPGNCDCPDVWEPVCTAEGFIFGNACEALCAGFEEFTPCEDPNEIPGCTDANAINYNPEATIDDGSCIFDECICPDIWEPVCTPDGLEFPNECFAMCEGFNDFFPCDTTVIWGCTDPVALNYDPIANFDDGSCEYEGDCVCPAIWAPVCTPEGLEFPNECIALCEGFNDFIPCEIYGCTDTAAYNYDPAAIYDDGSCVYDTTECNCPYIFDPVCDPATGIMYLNECIAICEGAMNYTSCATDTIPGCIDPWAINYDPAANLNDGSCMYPEDTLWLGCTDPYALNYDFLANEDDGSCIYPPTTDTTGNTPNYIPGCTDPAALNFNPVANFEDGSCEYADASSPDNPEADATFFVGCTDANAVNYNPIASASDGNCYYCSQPIQLTAGWNLISATCTPNDMAMEDVFTNMLGNVIQVKDLGGAYTPQLSTNFIGDWTMHEGYQVKVLADDILMIPGPSNVNLPMAIPLNAGWNIIAFPLPGDANPEAVFASVIGDVIQVKNLNGFYIPSVGNFMNDMTPTQGYMVKMASPQTLIVDASMANRPAEETNEVLKPQHFVIDRILSNRTSSIVVSNDNNPLNVGDEIGVFTQDGLLVGSAVYNNGHMGIMVYGDDVTTQEVDGLLDAEDLVFKVWDNTLQTETVVELDVVTGSKSFIENDIATAQFKSASTGLDELDNTLSFELAPNPVTDVLNINISTELNGQNVLLELRNIEGKLVDVVYEGNATAEMQLQYPVNHLPKGLYLMQVTSDKQLQTKRVLIK